MPGRKSLGQQKQDSIIRSTWWSPSSLCPGSVGEDPAHRVWHGHRLLARFPFAMTRPKSRLTQDQAKEIDGTESQCCPTLLRAGSFDEAQRSKWRCHWKNQTKQRNNRRMTNSPYRAKTQEWVEMGAAHVEQVSSRGCHLDSAVPTTTLHSFAELQDRSWH